MKKIKLLMPMLGLATLASSTITLIGCSCKNKSETQFTINTDQVDKTNLGEPVCNFKYKETSTITFSPIQGKTLDVDSLEIQIGNATYKKDNLTVNNSVITIDGQKVDSYTITIKASAKSTGKQISAFNVTCPEIKYANQTLTAADVVVKLTYDNGDQETLNCDENGYKVSYQKDGGVKTPVDNFATNGLTLTEGGSFKIIFEYVKDSKWNKSCDANIELFNADKFKAKFNEYSNNFNSCKKEYDISQIKYKVNDGEIKPIEECYYFFKPEQSNINYVRECQAILQDFMGGNHFSIGNNTDIKQTIDVLTDESGTFSITIDNKIEFKSNTAGGLEDIIINQNDYIEKLSVKMGEEDTKTVLITYSGEMTPKKIINVDSNIEIDSSIQTEIIKVSNEYNRFSESLNSTDVSVELAASVSSVKVKIKIFANEAEIQTEDYIFTPSGETQKYNLKLSRSALNFLKDEDTIKIKILPQS